METILKGVQPIEEPIVNEVDVVEGEEQMELYSIVSWLERATDDQLHELFGELKFNSLGRIQRILDVMRDVPNY